MSIWSRICIPVYKKVCQGSLSRNISILLFQKLYKKVPQNGENAYLVMKYPRASRALRWAPDPTLKRAHFTHMILLCTISNLGLSRSGPPPPIKSWIRPCGNGIDSNIRWRTLSNFIYFHLIVMNEK